MNQRIYYYVFGAMLFMASTVLICSCNNEQSKDEAEEPANEVITWDNSGAFFTDSMIEHTCEFIPAMYSTDGSYTEVSYPSFILMPYQYHGEEVTAAMKKADWYSLHKKDNNYFLEPAKLKFENVFDGIVDNDTNIRTGIKVTGQNDDDIFIANAGTLKTGALNSVSLDTNIVLPGKSFYFDYGDAHYRLYASGYRYKEGDEGHFSVRNYTMYLEKQEKGVTTKQPIAAIPNMYEFDTVPVILFVGDLDGDNEPDMVLNTVMYNSSSLVLYLSGNAEQGQLLKPMAMHISYGC